MQCALCGSDRVPHDAKFCPFCTQRLYLVAGLDYTELVTERTEGFTGRQWVFEAVDDWLADPEGARVFLLGGGPGTGKTAIAAQLLRMAEGEVPAKPYPHLDAGSVLFFQFCQALHNDTLDPLRFTKTLSLQLARQYPAFAQALTRTGMQDSQIHVETRQEVGTAADQALVVGAIFVVENLTISDLSARVAFDRVVAGPLKHVPQADPTDTILILLDALDEVLTYPGETLVDLLAHVLDDPRDLPPQIRFLLTSRPDQRVTHPLGQPALDLIADAPADVDDVQAYAHRRLRALDEPRRSDLAGRIAGASQGNFLYARYVIDDLPADLDQVEDPAELPLPEDLHDMYRQFLERELGRSLDTWDDDYAPLLGTLAVARGDGLTSAQLAGVTKQRRTRMRRLLRTCGQYLAGPQPDGPFRIYHQSFRDFLLEDATYRIFPQESNQDIADFYRETYGDKWGECDVYGLRHLPVHLVEEGQHDRLRELLLDCGWLRARLEATDVRALLADTYLMPGDAPALLEETVSCFRQATQADPKDLAAWEAIAVLQQTRATNDIGLGDLDAAESKLLEARSAARCTDPLDPGALALPGYVAKTLSWIATTRGNETEGQEHLQEAERVFRHVVQLYPSEAEGWKGLGDTQTALGDDEAAIESYERAIELVPIYTEAHYSIGYTCQHRMWAEPDDAEKWCRKALDAWQNAYDLVPLDPGYDEQDLDFISQQIRWLEGQCGEGM
jgi:tetratricopeptide (TPR) repeat protein